MNIQTEFSFPAAGGSCSAPSGVCALPVQTGVGSFRVCKKCGKMLPANEFYEYTRKNGSRKVFCSCKKCWNNSVKTWGENNQEKKTVQVAAWSEKNKKRVAENQRAWAAKNKDKIKRTQKKYYAANAEKRRANTARWAKNNPDKFRETMRSSARRRYAKSKKFRIAINLRFRLREEIRKSKTKKAGNTFDLLGCSIGEFKEYIESRFLPGMSWENHSYRGWHLDHIRPVASFDLTDPAQQRICFHYTNFQPLWGVENMRKGAKIIS